MRRTFRCILGSMGESIRHDHRHARGRQRDGRGIRRGDAYVLNDPYRGGTHLPDITVIVPVFYGDEAEPSAFVAARGHHADIGGIAPGSMPPDSRTIDEEGVLDRQCPAGRRGPFPRGGDARAARLGRMAGAQSGPQHLRPEGAARRLHARRRGARRRRRATTGRTWSPPTCATSSPMPRSRCGGCSTGSTTASSIMRWTMARTSVSQITIDKSGALGDLRLHRHQRPAARQFQRAFFDRPRGVALCRAHPDRRCDPDERRLPAADRR